MKPTRATESERKPHPQQTASEHKNINAAFKAFCERRGLQQGWRKVMKKGKNAANVEPK